MNQYFNYLIMIHLMNRFIYINHMIESERYMTRRNDNNQSTSEDIQIPQLVLPSRQVSHKKYKSRPLKTIIIGVAIFFAALVAGIAIGKAMSGFSQDINDVLLKQQNALLKLDQAAQNSQNLRDSLENISKTIQNFNVSSPAQFVLQNNVPIKSSPVQSANVAQLQQLLLQKQQRILSLASEVEQLKKNQPQQPSILITQIQIKRRNQNLLRTMMSTTYIKFQQSGHYYDANLMGLLTEYYASKNPQSIADFGCGKCEYIINLAEKGYSALGYDGTPFSNKQIIKKMDFSQKVDLGRKFDYVQSFEVGEHIFSDFEDNFISNLANHAKKGIVMSWSIVGQGGYMHVNNRDNSYVIERIERYGFKYDSEETQRFRKVLQNWFHNTIMVFKSLNPS